MTNSGSGSSMTILDRLQVAEKRQSERDQVLAVNWDGIYGRLAALEIAVGGQSGPQGGATVAAVPPNHAEGACSTGPPRTYAVNLGLTSDPILESVAGALRSISDSIERQEQNLGRLTAAMLKVAAKEQASATVKPAPAAAKRPKR